MHTGRVLIITCALSLALLIACKNGGGGGPKATQTPEASPTPAGTTVASDDGKLSLFIPEGAMPEGADVSITSVAHDALPVELGQLAGSGTGYRLEPDGLTFSQPATATLTLDRSELDDAEGTQSAYALVSFNAAAGREVLDSETAHTFGEETVTVSAEVSHFSWITKTKGSLMVMLTEVARRQVVGVPFLVEAQVRNWRGDPIELRNITGSWFRTDPVDYLQGNPGNLTFGKFITSTNVSGIHLTGEEVKMVCKAPGVGSYGVKASAVSHLTDGSGPDVTLRVSLGSEVECVTAEEATRNPPTLTPTPTDYVLELPPSYKISQRPGCRHNGPGDSDHLDDVAVVDEDGAPVAGAEVALQVEGPGLVSPQGQPVASVTNEATTNASGVASFVSPIRSFGAYISTVLSVTAPDGTAAELDPASMLVASFTVGATC